MYFCQHEQRSLLTMIFLDSYDARYDCSALLLTVSSFS